jgi:hypothetical protein
MSADSEVDDTDGEFAKKRRMTWAALIKNVQS